MITVIRTLCELYHYCGQISDSNNLKETAQRPRASMTFKDILPMRHFPQLGLASGVSMISKDNDARQLFTKRECIRHFILDL